MLDEGCYGGVGIGGQRLSCGWLTHCGSVLSHNAFHHPDDLPGHGWGHGGGIDRTVGVRP